MLMETNYVNIILFRYFDQFIDIILINPKFALWTASNYIMRLSCTKFGINSDKDAFSF